MRYSEMNQLIAIEESCEVIDEFGEVSVTWKDMGRYLAKIEILFDKRRIGHEIALDRRIVNINYFEVTMRYVSLSYKSRILWNGRILNVLKLFDPTNHRRFLKVIVEEMQ